mmetsp:Transcript_34372/g.97360  ORF Transcript_34372/g.97360 Transcript_34372/m.97360 type:complete len:285 (+) Transcript_34372:90-944(+)
MIPQKSEGKQVEWLGKELAERGLLGGPHPTQAPVYSYNSIPQLLDSYPAARLSITPVTGQLSRPISRARGSDMVSSLPHLTPIYRPFGHRTPDTFAARSSTSQAVIRRGYYNAFNGLQSPVPMTAPAGPAGGDPRSRGWHLSPPRTPFSTHSQHRVPLPMDGRFMADYIHEYQLRLQDTIMKTRQASGRPAWQQQRRHSQGELHIQESRQHNQRAGHVVPARASSGADRPHPHFQNLTAWEHSTAPPRIRFRAYNVRSTVRRELAYKGVSNQLDSYTQQDTCLR